VLWSAACAFSYPFYVHTCTLLLTARYLLKFITVTLDWFLLPYFDLTILFFSLYFSTSAFVCLGCLSKCPSLGTSRNQPLFFSSGGQEAQDWGPAGLVFRDSPLPGLQTVTVLCPHMAEGRERTYVPLSFLRSVQITSKGLHCHELSTSHRPSQPHHTGYGVSLCEFMGTHIQSITSSLGICCFDTFQEVLRWMKFQ
jgi:hypothetical protein